MKLAKLTSNRQHSVDWKAPTLSSIPRVANYCPQDKSTPPLVFISTVLLKHSHTHWFTYCLWLGCFDITRAIWGIATKTSWPAKIKYGYSLALYRQFANPWSTLSSPESFWQDIGSDLETGHLFDFKKDSLLHDVFTHARLLPNPSPIVKILTSSTNFAEFCKLL